MNMLFFSLRYDVTGRRSLSGLRRKLAEAGSHGKLAEATGSCLLAQYVMELAGLDRGTHGCKPSPLSGDAGRLAQDSNLTNLPFYIHLKPTSTEKNHRNFFRKLFKKFSFFLTFLTFNIFCVFTFL
jgi:hypothetical protein